MDPSVDHPPLPVASDYPHSTNTAFTPFSASASATASAPTPTPSATPFPFSAASTAAASANPTVPAANPSPSHVPTGTHPSYNEMITAAILGLREKDGSSKKAISKYIDRFYSNLPSSHPALLAHHLKRLKNSGQLVMNKKSYMLPSSISPPPPGSSGPTASSSPPQPSAFPLPVFPTDTSISPNPASATPSTKRRGRPPKSRDAAEQLPTGAPILQPSATEIRPVSDAPPPVLAGFQVQVGFGNGGITSPPSKRRGRPPKSKTPFPVSVVQPQPADDSSPPSNAGNPDNLVDPGLVNGSVITPSKRRPGRPPKVKPEIITDSEAEVGVENTRPAMVNNRPGKPPKKLKAVSLFKASGRPRGRPRKNPVPVGLGGQEHGGAPVGTAAAAAAAAPVAVGAKRRGRPPVNRYLEDGAVARVGMKRRGRPPGRGGGVAMMMSRRGRGRGRGFGTGRRPGRPRKYDPSSLQQMAAAATNEELSRKLEYVQIKIKKAVGLLKPHVHGLDNLDFMTALEDLEELAEMDIMASRNTNTGGEAAPGEGPAGPTVDVTAPPAGEASASSPKDIAVPASTTMEEVRATEPLYSSMPDAVNQQEAANK